MRRSIVALACAALAACHHNASPEDGVQLAIADATNAHVTLSAEGARVAVAWAVTTEGGTNVYAAVSTNGGREFGAPVRVNDVDGDANANGEQPPRVVLKGESLAVVWVSKRSGTSMIRAAASADGGRTFSPARSISPSGLSGARGWESAAIADDGAVHAVWLDGRNASHPSASAPSGLRRDSAPSASRPAHQHGDMRQDIIHAMWRGSEAPVETPVAANVCFCCKTAVASRGRDVFVAWRHLFPGGVRDIALARSSDGGATFSEPVRVSPDNWKLDACPDDGPSLAIAADGEVRVAWPTLVQDAGKPRMAIFESASRDGGATFSPRVRVSTDGTSASHPRIAIDTAGTRAIVWDESNGEHRRAMIRAGGGPAAPIETAGAASYPAIAATSEGFVTAWTEQSAGKSVVRVARASQAQR